MGSRLPPTSQIVSENCDQSNGDESCSIEHTEDIAHAVVESGDGIDKEQLNLSGSQMEDRDENCVPASVVDQSATDKLIPPEKRINGLRFGTVIGHTYTDNKHTNLETWLPEALNQTHAKRKVLLDLEHRAAKFIAEEASLPYLLLKSQDTYQRLAIYRVTAYFGLGCRPKDGDLIAWRTPYTRIPEENIRFDAMLRELREEGTDQRQMDQSGDVRSIQAYHHIRDPQVFYHRQPYSPIQPSPMRFRNPSLQNRFGPPQQSFSFNVAAPSHPLSARVPPPIRRYFGGGVRFRGNLLPGGNFTNHQQPRYGNQGDAITATHESIGGNGVNRSRSVPNVISTVPDTDNAHRSTSGVSIKSIESHTGDFSDRSNSAEPKATTDIKDSSASCQEIDCESNQSDNVTASIQSANTSTLPSDNRVVSCNASTIGQSNNGALHTLSQANDINDGSKYGVMHQMSGMTLNAVSKDNFSTTEGTDRMAALVGASVMSASGTGNTQFFQEVAYTNDHLSAGSMATMSPMRMGAPTYPPPMTVPRPSTLSVYNSHAYSAQPMTPGQPTMLTMTDSQGFIQASPQVGHSYPVATVPPGGNALDQSSSVPVLPQPQSVLYLAPQQMSHQSHHQSPSIIYLNPVQPNPVMSSGGQSSEYVTHYRDMPPPTAGPPPPLSVPYSSYQQVVTSVPPPGAGSVTYYVGPTEVIYTGATGTSQQHQQQQQVNSQEYVQYPSGTALPFAGYTLSPYLPQQMQSPAAAGYVNYFPTPAAYPGTYATSTPLVFQSAAGYSVPPPPTEMARQSSEVHHPVQWVPVAGGKGTGFMPTVHIAPSTPTRALTVADVQLVGQPITVHPYMPFAPIAANQRMEVAAPVMAGTNQPTYRIPPPAQTTYHKSASFGIRPSGGSFRSTGPTGIAIAARPSMQYQ